MPGGVISAFNFQVRMFPIAVVFASFAHICEFISQMCSMELKKKKKKVIPRITLKMASEDLQV